MGKRKPDLKGQMEDVWHRSKVRTQAERKKAKGLKTHTGLKPQRGQETPGIYKKWNKEQREGKLKH